MDEQSYYSWGEKNTTLTVTSILAVPCETSKNNLKTKIGERFHGVIYNIL